MTTLIDISKYTERFTEYPAEFVQFCTENGVKLPSIDTLKGQAYALMAQPDVRGQKHLTRKETDAFFVQLKMECRDSIQQFNKTLGLKVKKRKYYLFYPFEVDLTHVVKRQEARISGDKDAQINAIKQWWRENLVNVPNEQWQTGHLDPTTPDASEANLAWQPPLQARYRNRFKWDTMFHKMWPTGQELMTKMDEYYTETEQKEIFVELMRKFLLSDDEL
jgi:hypothetical protein